MGLKIYPIIKFSGMDALLFCCGALVACQKNPVSLSASVYMIAHIFYWHFDEKGSFPYNPKGPQYALYDAFFHEQGQENADPFHPRIYRPFDFDHENLSVKDSLVFYLNKSDVFLCEDSAQSIALLVSKARIEDEGFYVIGNDVCIYHYAADQDVSTSDLIGLPLKTIGARFPLLGKECLVKKNETQRAKQNK